MKEAGKSPTVAKGPRYLQLMAHANNFPKTRNVRNPTKHLVQLELPKSLMLFSIRLIDRHAKSRSMPAFMAANPGSSGITGQDFFRTFVRKKILKNIFA
jgi:hypothetical protein